MPDSEDPPTAFPALYEELRRLARRRLDREGAGHTLQTTALVHEAFLRLEAQDHRTYGNRRQVLVAAAAMIRRILIDHARKRFRRRSHEREAVMLQDALLLPDHPMVDLIALHDALEALEHRSPRKARLVELRFFAGLTFAECAAELGLSLSVVKADWAFARSWIKRELERATSD